MILQALRGAFDACANWVIGINSTLAPYTDWYFSRLHELLPDPFFNTQAFLLFFALVFALYWLVPRRWQMTRIWLLVAASFHFYAAWSKDLAFLVTTTTLADYLFGRLMGATEPQEDPFRRGVRQHRNEPGRVVLFLVSRFLFERVARFSAPARLRSGLREVGCGADHRSLWDQLLHV